MTDGVPPLKTYTVVGYWEGGENPCAFAVVEGDNIVYPGMGADYFDGGTWAVSVNAEDPDEAEGKALEDVSADPHGEDDTEES